MDDSSSDRESTSESPPPFESFPNSAPHASTFCCATDKEIRSFLGGQTGSEIPNLMVITEANKQTDMGGSSFYSYVIRATNSAGGILLESKHRYSEFESLQKVLKAIYPYVVIPPIPEKHSFADYATKQSKAKDDPRMIEKRKRMLQSFLNRIITHPLLGREHIYHRFLTEANWTEALTSSGHARLLKKKKNPIQKVMEKQTLKNPDPHFQSAEEYTDKFSKHISHTYTVNKKVVKHYSDLALCFSDLGHLYNSFSLSEPNIGPTIEKVGAAYDELVKTSNDLVQNLDNSVNEPLQEYTQFSKMIDKVLRNRLRKQIDLETVTDTLEQKRAYLSGLEKSEAEAQRLSAVLNAEGAGNLPRSTGGTGGSGIMATINSLIDNDPEMTRRNNISKTKDRIIELADEKEKQQGNLKLLNAGVQKDLNRFQRDKIRDIRHMLLEYAKMHKEYCEANAKVWQAVKADLDKEKEPTP